MHIFYTLITDFQIGNPGLVSPVAKAVQGLLLLGALPWPFDKIIERLAADSWERMHFVMETCMNEVRKHENEIGQLRKAMSAEESRAREQVSWELLLDVNVILGVSSRTQKPPSRLAAPPLMSAVTCPRVGKPGKWPSSSDLPKRRPRK